MDKISFNGYIYQEKEKEKEWLNNNLYTHICYACTLCLFHKSCKMPIYVYKLFILILKFSSQVLITKKVFAKSKQNLIIFKPLRFFFNV